MIQIIYVVRREDRAGRSSALCAFSTLVRADAERDVFRTGARARGEKVRGFTRAWEVNYYVEPVPLED